MKRFIPLLFSILLLSGCGSELTAGGAGLGAGIFGSKTLEGIEADLEKQKQVMINRYNRMVDAGATAEDLADLRRGIEKMEYLQQGAKTTKTLLGIDWSDPAEAGSGIGLVATLAYAILNKRKLKKNQRKLTKTLAGVNEFKSTHEPNISGELENCMAKKS